MKQTNKYQMNLHTKSILPIAFILLMISSCIKEVPEKQTIFFDVHYPAQIKLDTPDTLSVKITSATYIDTIRLIEYDTLYTRYKRTKGDTILEFENNFIYNPKSLGEKDLYLKVHSQESIREYNISFTVVE